MFKWFNCWILLPCQVLAFWFFSGTVSAKSFKFCMIHWALPLETTFDDLDIISRLWKYYKDETAHCIFLVNSYLNVKHFTLIVFSELYPLVEVLHMSFCFAGNLVSLPYKAVASVDAVLPRPSLCRCCDAMGNILKAQHAVYAPGPTCCLCSRPNMLCFLTGAIPMGLILQKFCVWCLCMFCYV